MFAERLHQHRDAIGGDFVIAIEAEKFLRFMQEQHPEELHEWLDAKAVEFIAATLRSQLQGERARATARAGARAFRAAADELEAAGGIDEPGALDAFAQAFAVNRANLWRSVADMTGDDHRFVAGEYERRGKRELALAAFHRAIAKKVGNRRTGDVLSEDDYTRLRSSFA